MGLIYKVTNILTTFLSSVSSMEVCCSWSNLWLSQSSFCWASPMIPATESLWLDWLDESGLGGLFSSDNSQPRVFFFLLWREV